MLKKMRKRFLNDVLEKLEEISHKIETIDDRIETIDDRIETIDDKIETIDDKIDNIDGKASMELTQLSSIYSYCQNSFIANSDILNTIQYKYYHNIHRMLKIYEIADEGYSVCRVGRNYDGGYVMITPFSRIKIAYSIGICDDVSWDKGVAEKEYRIYQYDHTINNLPEENAAFIWKKVGLGNACKGPNLEPLEKMLENNGHKDIEGMLLKIDIEGNEWDFLNGCSKSTFDQFDQIIIELHDISKIAQWDKITRGLERITETHAAVHVHANIYCPIVYCGDLITPNAMEVTLLNRRVYSLLDGNIRLPRLEDCPNEPIIQDAWLGKWNV